MITTAVGADPGIDPADPPRRWLPVLVLAVVCVACSGYSLYLARTGLVTTPDSVVYDGAAANLLAGKGITSPITTVAVAVAPDQAMREAGRVPLVQFPPLFPAALALLGHAGLSPPDAAPVLNPSLFGVDLFLLGLIVVAVVGRRRWGWSLAVIALVGCGLPLFQRSPLLLLSGSILSEPLMIACALGSLLALIAFLRKASWRWLLLAAALASLATMTRFVGVAMVFTVVAAVWLRLPATRAVRATWAGVVTAIGVVPTLAVILVAQSCLVGEGHPLTYGSPTLAMRQLGTGIDQWFVPTTAPTWARLVTMLGFVAIVVVAFSRRPLPLRLTDEFRQHRRARAVVLLAAVVYLVVVVASRLTFDQNVALSGRHLELLWMLVLVLAADAVAGAELERVGQVAFRAASLALAVAIAVPGARDLPRVTRSGYRPASHVVSSRAFAKAVHAIPGHLVIFSDLADGVYADAGRGAFMVPCRRDYYTHDPNPLYQRDVGQLVTLVRTHRATLVLSYFSPLGESGCFDGVDANHHGLVTGATFPGGGVYRLATASS